MTAVRETLASRTQAIGRELLAAARQAPPSRLFSERLMDYALAGEALKTALFRFADVFPTLQTPRRVHEILHEYLAGQQLPAGLSLAMSAGSLFKGVEARAIATQIETMAGRFIAGRDLKDAIPVLQARWESGIAFSVDLLGEACLSDAEAEAYRARYLDVVAKLPDVVSAIPARPLLERDHLGPVPRSNVSVKISSLYARTKPAAFEASIAGLLEAIGPVLASANRGGVLINFDMEQQSLKDITLALFMRAAERYDFEAGLALQAYLKSAEDDARRLIAWTQRTGRVVTVRLIKGAYWDYETIHAELMNWPSPVFAHKGETDASFERLTGLLLSATPRRRGEGGIKLAIGTHNVRSIAHALATVEAAELPPEALEIQMLRGMADELKTAVIERDLRLREYVPLGEMIPGMAYLVRRLLENTSNESWLRAGFRENVPDEVLLATPAAHPPDAPASRAEKTSFEDEPPRDFADESQRHAFAAAVGQAAAPHIAIVRDAAIVGRIMETAAGARERWRAVGIEKRAGILRRAAEIMRSRRDALAAMMVVESHKTWGEADADVCEAIDYLRFYADAGTQLLGSRQLTHLVGESNRMVYEPRGPAVVIAPWNFPLAIPCGMTAASLVAGNPTILKPAEQTPGIARALVDLLHEAGVPQEALQYVPGEGETVGRALIADPRTAVIAFTGSAAVGLEILRIAHSRTLPTPAGGAHTPGDGTAPFEFVVPQVICEMGGKNAIIVDDTADLDETVMGVRHSAFSYAGQKCSACSRLIVVDAIHDALVKRLVEATRSMTLGDPRDPATDMGPVIDDAAAKKVWAYVAIGNREARRVYPLEDVGHGRMIVPHIFVDVPRDSQLANEEIFGPVLAVFRVKDFEEALSLANASPYKLTGGVYSRSPATLDRAREAFSVGNLYLNRPITGATVGRQPFGGAGLSGLGTKAGAAEYVLGFAVGRVVSESTMRRGFAPGDAPGETG